MTPVIYRLLLAQFLSAFADNAILFALVAMAYNIPDAPAWYVPALQSMFLLAYVLSAPWVGAWADQFAKAKVLVSANLVKAVGAALLLPDFGVYPALLAYGVVGIGGALYSPAKYGILPELAGHAALVKANSWIEGSTILAILTGSWVGGQLADISPSLAFACVIALFLGSAALGWGLPGKAVAAPDTSAKLPLFFRHIGQFLASSRARFAILAAALFWATAATLRVILVAWVPLVLLGKGASAVAELTLFLALGIIVGSAIVPGLIPLEHLRRVRVPAYLMGAAIIGLGFCSGIWPARGVLFVIGTMGGIFIVPINATLQEMGQQSIGSGAAVAMQNFFQNAAMLLGVGAYMFAAAIDINPASAIWAVGALVMVATLLISLNLPDNNL